MSDMMAREIPNASHRGALIPVFEPRVGIRAVEGGFIVALHQGKSDIAVREEVHTSKADAITAATRLHASCLEAMENWAAAQERERQRYAQSGAGHAVSGTSGPINSPYVGAQERAR